MPPLPSLPEIPPSREGCRAFSLVEVVAALGIFVFSLVALLGLLPVALQSARDSLDISTALELAEKLSAKFNGVAFTSLSTIPSPVIYYYNDIGEEVSASSDAAVYQASVELGASESPQLIRVAISVRLAQGSPAPHEFCYLILNNE